MRAVAYAVSLLVDLVAAVRRRRCTHRMVEMSDGPVCSGCGRSWTWAASPTP